MRAMTSTIQFPCWVIGLMSGTSADGVDAALLYTDGKTITKPGASLFVPYDEPMRQSIFAAMRGEGDINATAYALTEIHAEAVRRLIGASGVEDVKLIGFHGQTTKHDPSQKLTVQIGDAPWLAEKTGIPVIYDFRRADIEAGGQGAPLVPLFHAARAANLEGPLMVVNIGGVANVTYLDGDDILAFDCGPGNAPIDDWVRRHTDMRCDEGGKLGAEGKVDEIALAKFLADPFFEKPAPKSLDRYHFHKLLHSLEAEGKWSIEDGAATLAAMTAAAIAEAVRLVPKQPKQLLICGGGRHNPTLMGMLRSYQLPAVPVEQVGWNGDMLEAEAFAYLAARSIQQLPLSLPGTTGVPKPTSGGKLAPVSHHHHDDEDEDNTSPRSCCR